MKQCNSLEEVRDAIDMIDTQLVDLISQRAQLVRRAAAFKNSIDEVKAQSRIDAVMQRVRKRAIELNLNPNMISDLFKIMVDDMVETEIAEFRNDTKF